MCRRCPGRHSGRVACAPLLAGATACGALPPRRAVSIEAAGGLMTGGPSSERVRDDARAEDEQRVD